VPDLSDFPLKSYQIVSRETFLSGRGRKPYKAEASIRCSCGKISQNFGAIEIERRLLPFGAPHCQKPSPL
jgi:hypothetical protein